MLSSFARRHTPAAINRSTALPWRKPRDREVRAAEGPLCGANPGAEIALCQNGSSQNALSQNGYGCVRIGGPPLLQLLMLMMKKKKKKEEERMLKEENLTTPT